MTDSSGRHRLVGWALVLCIQSFACQAQNRSGTDGETHFLKSCSPALNDCGDGLSCLCGVCTLTCAETAECSELPVARCVSAATSICGGSPAADRCDVECLHSDDCVAVSAFHVCSDGVCRTEAPPPPASAPEAASTTDAAMLAGCEFASAAPNEVLLIGDSFFGNTHQITAYLEASARAAGILEAGERYRDNSRVTANTLRDGAMGIPGQYADAVADGPVHVVIMNGGGADALVANCDPVEASCPALAAAVAQVTSLLAQMATDGVEHVVYAYYPDPTDNALREKLDALREPVEAACQEAPLTCDWLDLRATFADHPDYLAPDGALPSAKGSEASATAIWQLLQSRCSSP